MALLYLAVGDETGAWGAVCRYARAWSPIEHSQVEPIQLFASYALGQLITQERGLAILYRRFDQPNPSHLRRVRGRRSRSRSTASHDQDP